MDIHCQFSAPLKADGVPPNLNSQEWEFSQMVCSSTPSSSTLPDYISKITSTSTPERSFYISNTIDLGQVLLLGFLILILVFSIMISVKHLIFKKF
jgi:predicted S18 family serine protease